MISNTKNGASSNRFRELIPLFLLLIPVISTHGQDKAGDVIHYCHGVPGIPGTPGIPGNPGLQGPRGDRGETGQKGDNGSNGTPGINGLTGESGVSGEKGNSGVPGMPGKIGPIGIPGVKGDQGDKGNTGDPGPMQTTSRVAFSVARTFELLSGDQPVTYDNIYTNIGGHYNESTGNFTCPLSGVYYFTMAAVKPRDGNNLDICFMKNQIQLTCAYSNTAGYGTGTNSIILELHEGDGIWVKLGWSYALFSSSSGYTTFSGYMINTDYTIIT
uniref:Complement C1q subcomponent subunit B-like n=1 Tax=Saccoglossus kowalevskii TaxID=10224 RepID=A0ABM0GXD6_SACKO|nr:PREDICTED: complement C1q subcomponent subunit B-like [Saccoglossus kowalevskii]